MRKIFLFFFISAAVHNPCQIEQGLVIFFIIMGPGGLVHGNLTKESELLLNVGGTLFYYTQYYCAKSKDQRGLLSLNTGALASN
jgi:hypothetical protein